MEPAKPAEKPRRIVLTGGPGAGKTAVLDFVRHVVGRDVAILPEAASMLFRGGFPREPDVAARCSAQRAIYRVQVELEKLFASRPGVKAILCDRGTLDGLAYWPAAADEFFAEVGTTLEEQLRQYDAVIHLAPATRNNGYHRNEVRTETAAEAAAIDARILDAWSTHPNRHLVPSTPRFLDKVARVMAVLESELAVMDAGAGPAEPRSER